SITAAVTIFSDRCITNLHFFSDVFFRCSGARAVRARSSAPGTPPV
ncbi:hypothetical protein A2U01_0108179, partial [Trifolium medium]|nr:hypothetical protein [Trifolium medium]